VVGQYVGVRRFVVVAALLSAGVASVVAGCTPNCQAFESSIAAGAQGASTPRGAIEAWAPSAPEGFSTDPHAWKPSKAEALTFESGDQTVEVVKGTAPQTGYFVFSGGTCKP